MSWRYDRDFFYDLHGKVIFQRLLFLRTVAFRKKLVFLEKLLFKSLLPFITFVNYERAYLGEQFLHILCSYFDVALAQL